MKFTLYNTGKTDVPYLLEGIEEYCNRIRHFVDFTILDIPGIKSGRKMSPEIVKKKEGEILKRVLSKYDIIILLDENGTEMNSRKFAEWLNALQTKSYKQVAFVSGGAYGFSEDIHKLAKYKISLSKMTYTHQMVRLIFVEQLYRAYTLIKGMKYHND